MSAAVSAGTRRAYGSYWNRVIEHWGSRRLDEPSLSEIRQLMAYIKTHVVARRNARGGRSAEEHLVAALRCLSRRAVEDGLIAEADNPARKVAKPRRLPTTRRALPDNRLAQINEITATTVIYLELDTLLRGWSPDRCQSTPVPRGINVERPQRTSSRTNDVEARKARCTVSWPAERLATGRLDCYAAIVTVQAGVGDRHREAEYRAARRTLHGWERDMSDATEAVDRQLAASRDRDLERFLGVTPRTSRSGTSTAMC